VTTPVLLEIFATWCPHCQRETVVMNEIAAKYAGKVAIVAVSGSNVGMDGSSPESQADVNAFGAQFHVAYPIAFDPDLKVIQDYGGSGFPTLVLIDRNKKVVWMTSGETPASAIAAAIAKVS
jgi:thiol-disulfide isomerase/thioredoxin